MDRDGHGGYERTRRVPAAYAWTKTDGGRCSASRFCDSSGGGSTVWQCRFAGGQLPKYTRLNDIQSLEEFQDWLEMFWLVTDLANEEKLTPIESAALEGSTKLWWHFATTFSSWEDFTAGFIVEFSCIDTKRRLKQKCSTQKKILKNLFTRLRPIMTGSAAKFQDCKSFVVCCGKCTRNSKTLQKANSLPISCNWPCFEAVAVQAAAASDRPSGEGPRLPVSCKRDWPARNTAQSVDGCGCRAVSVAAAGILRAFSSHSDTAILPLRPAAWAGHSYYKATSHGVVTGVATA